MWIALRKSLRTVVEQVSVADVASGELRTAIDRLADDPEAWVCGSPVELRSGRELVPRGRTVCLSPKPY